MQDEPNKTPETETAAPAPEAAQASQSASADVVASGVTHAHTDLPPEEIERLSNDLVVALKTVFDPEIPVDIYELGLIYRVDIDENRNVEADMTLTAPGCPVAGEMPIWVENAISSVPGVGEVRVNLVFDPPWDMSRMSEEARVALNMF
ncbi:SUF system Fe-S cluster assembly protein [Methyloligella sp. 2.7D]|uniref:SUF system Fe-S cluster assembly protein n=1 Tax=unclassified Methyloligella TaxID=2625955 RepID=UPI00157C8AB8|nr:SUF system Fe-S cluster assembly protein [Methyloligella sp. GL2]QKP77797.1 SUF system Fe-S cluster assembly protein [Methyloligella sp. GL2]